jgi:hypothetical protein
MVAPCTVCLLLLRELYDQGLAARQQALNFVLDLPARRDEAQVRDVYAYRAQYLGPLAVLA